MMRHRLERGLVGSLLALPDGALRRVVAELGGVPATRGVPLDVRAALLLHLDRRLRAPLEQLPPIEARAEADARVRVTLGPIPDGVLVQPVRTARVHGLLVRPRHDSPGPLVVYFHPGGFVFGRPEWTLPFASVLAGTLRARVLSVAYPLAPEHRLPEIHAAASAAVGAALDLAPGWGCRGGWVLAGDSAGGHIAARLAQTLPPEARPAVQLLVVPLLDAAADARSRVEWASAHPVSEAFVGWALNHALPDGADLCAPDISPGRARRLDRLPPAVIATAGFDPLLDEGDTYARRLAEAGVPVRHHRLLHLPHAFTVLAGAIGAAGDAMRGLARDVGALLEADGRAARSFPRGRRSIDGRAR